MVRLNEEALEKLAQCAYETYAGVTDGTKAEDYHALDILPYDKLSPNSKKHWKDVANAVVLASWNIDFGDAT